MSLSGQQFKELHEALISAFIDKVSLEQMLLFQLNKHLREIAGEGSLKDIIFKLIQTADAEGWVEDLVRAASDYNSGNIKLGAIAKSLLPNNELARSFIINNLRDKKFTKKLIQNNPLGTDITIDETYDDKDPTFTEELGKDHTSYKYAFSAIEEQVIYPLESLYRSQVTQPSSESLPPKRTVLILASSPVDLARLRLDKEVREIDEALRRSQKRSHFDLQQKWAVRPDDLRRALLDYNPQIVHFAGHGTGEQGLVLENQLGTAQLVETDALANLFEMFTESGLECVVLNACYAEMQAEAIVKYVKYVTGMSNKVSDVAAIKFATGFYDALGAGWTYEKAFGMGRNAIALEGIQEDMIPVFKSKIL
jgi:hypothetical protein